MDAKKQAMEEVCEFANMKRLWLFFFTYVFGKNDLMYLPFIWKRVRGQSTIKLLARPKDIASFYKAFKHFSEKENKMSEQKVSEMMTFENITRGLIAHFLAVGKPDKAKEYEARFNEFIAKKPKTQKPKFANKNANKSTK